MRTALLLTALLLAPAALAGCLGEAPTARTDDDPAPPPGEAPWARPLPDVITGLDLVGSVTGVPAAAGIWTEGDHGYVGGVNTGFYVVDLSTPEAPRVVGHAEGFYARDVDLLHYDDGRTVAVIASSGEGMRFINVTDPTTPEVLGRVEGFNAHNVAVVPGTHLVYNSRSVSTEQVLDVVDASDPENPRVVATVDHLTTCHDVTFHPPTNRAYCPGVEETQIWDTTDPLAPRLVSRVVNPLINIHHWALPAHGGDLLIIGDEFAGSTPAAAGCGAYADAPAGDRAVSDPVGAVWFYDVSDEQNPRPLGYVAPSAPVGSAEPAPCTAHFGALVGDRDQLVVGWRTAGVHLIDFTDPTSPRILDGFSEGTETWEARVHNGYVFTGDTRRGVDVLTFAGGAQE